MEIPDIDLDSDYRGIYIGKHLSTCAFHVSLFYSIKIILKSTIIIEAHCKDIETEVYKNIPLFSSCAQMELLRTDTSLRPSSA